MKRKSILMMIVALLFCGTAMAQNWYDKARQAVTPQVSLAYDGNKTGHSVQGTSLIYFCTSADSLRPISFSYNVAGKDLSPNFGVWSLYATSSMALTSAGDYDFTSGNGGAGNTFNVESVGAGGYIFQYTATNELCGLHVGEKYWVIVFVLPTTASEISKDTIVCPASGLHPNPLNITVANSFPYTALYKQAGITVTYVPTSWTINRAVSKVGQDTAVKAKLTLTLDPVHTPHDGTPGKAHYTDFNAYLCGSTLDYRLTVKVRDISQLSPLGYAVCEADTTGGNGQRSPSAIFTVPERQLATGSWSPATIKSVGDVWTQIGSTTSYYKKFTYAYTDCSNTARTVVDSLVLTKSPQDNFWGQDTAKICRTGNDTVSLIAKWNGAPHKITVPALDANGNGHTWTELGKWIGPGAYQYASPLPGALHGGHNVSTWAPNYFASNVGYHYRFQITAGQICFAGDSGRLVIIMQDPFAGMDHTAQFCSTTTSIDLKLLTGLADADWKPATLISNGVLNTTTLPKGTSKFTYKVASCAGDTVTNVLTLTKTDFVKTPSVINVKYCVTRLPEQINLWDVATVVNPNGNAWGGTSSGHVGFDVNTGIIDIATFGNTQGTYTFTTSTLSSTCVGHEITVNIIFTDTIL